MKINLENWNFDTTATIFICIFIPLFLYFTYWLFITGIIGATKMLQSKSWNNTIGKILDSEIRFMKFGSETNGDVSFKFVLKKSYSYSVNGKEYKSNNTLASDYLYEKEFKPMSKFPKRYGDYTTNANYIEKIEEIKKMIGRSVTVYFNSNNPKNACLENRFEKEVFLPIFFGLLFGGGLTYLTYYIIKPIFE